MKSSWRKQLLGGRIVIKIICKASGSSPSRQLMRQHFAHPLEVRCDHVT